MRLREFNEKEKLKKANEKLKKYKTAAGADATAADAAGNFARGNTRFKGINRATNRQFDNDSKLAKLKEVAPPGAKAERMVRHIKAGYARDGKLTPKEKGIAFATAWKAHNAGQVEEATGDERFDSMMGQIQREPRIPDSQMPPTDVRDLHAWAVKNHKPYHKIFAEWAMREGFKSVAPALQKAGNLDSDAIDYWTPDVWKLRFGPDAEMPRHWSKERVPDELRDYLETVFDAYENIWQDWPTEYRQIGDQGITEMDKSEPSAGRDTGPRPGPDREAKPISAKKATKDAADMLNRAFQDSHKKKDVKEAQLDELSIDTLRNYMRAQPARIKGPAGLATTNPKKAARIVDPEKGDMRRALTKLKDPAYGQQGMAEPQLDEFARGEGGYGPFKIYIGHHFTDQQFSTFGAAKEAVGILQNDDPALADGDWRIVNGTGKTVWEHVPAYDDMDESLAEDSLAAMRRLAGIVPQVPAVVPNGPSQYRHMPTAVQPR